MARSLSVIAADRNFMVLLVAMPVVLAALARVVPGHAGFSVTEVTEPRELDTRLVVLVLGAILIGGAISVRELVKERPILARERAVGLSVSAYLASKVAVLGSLAAIQSVLFAVLAVAGMPGPDHGGVLGLGTFEVVLPLALVAVSMVMAGSAHLSAGQLERADDAGPGGAGHGAVGAVRRTAARGRAGRSRTVVPARARQVRLRGDGVGGRVGARQDGVRGVPGRVVDEFGVVLDARRGRSGVISLALLALARWATGRSIRRSSKR